MRLLELLAAQKTYAVCLGLGLLVALLVTPVAMKLAHWLGALDRPNHRKIHRVPTPLMGGLGIAAGMWVPLALLAFHDNLVTRNLAYGGWQSLLTIFLSGISMLVLGIVDDRLGLRARTKFTVQIPIAVLLVWSGVSFSVLNIPFIGIIDLGWCGPVLSVIWIVGITNALNLIDGMDGLAAGVALFVAVTNGILAIMNNHPLLAVVMWSMAGGCLGFLRYNYNPAKVFLGDTGSLFLGMTLAVTSMQASFKGSVATSMLVPVLVLGYPALDTLLAMGRRAITGRPIFEGDKSHIHHRLLQLGFSQHRTVLMLYAVSATFCLVALMTVVGNELILGISIGALAVIFWIGLRALGFMNYFVGKGLEERLWHRKAKIHMIMYQSKLQRAKRREDVFDVLREASELFGAVRVEVEQGTGLLGRASQWQWVWKRDDAGSAHAEETLEHYTLKFTDHDWMATIIWDKRKVLDPINQEQRSRLEELFFMADERMGELVAHISSLRQAVSKEAAPISTETAPRKAQ